MAIHTGDRLGAYKILSPLGAGGMGEVYRARDLRLDRDVAIKVLPDGFKNDPAARARFEREAKAVAALNHSNILIIHDVGSDDGTDYVVTELLEGETLSETLDRENALSWRRAVDIAHAIAKGLTAAHEKGIIHRDIKPSNIFLTKEGAVKILDFGLAKALNIQPPPSSPTSDSARAEAMMTTKPGDATAPGTLIGTIGYMSPEQARGLTASTASDVFALGCVLYEMLTGKRPFVGDTATDTLIAIVKNEPEPVTHLAEGVPGDLAKTLQKMLVKDPADRIQNGGELAETLDSLLASQEATGPNRALRIGGAVVVTIVLALFVASIFRTSGRDSSVDQARNVTLEEARALVDQEDWFTAFGILTEIEGLIPDDPLFQETLDDASSIVKVETDPPGAEVAYKPYREPDSEWIRIDASDLEAVRLPRGVYRWRITKDGYAPSEVARFMPHPTIRNISTFTILENLKISEPPRGTIHFAVLPKDEVPDGMLAMEEAKFEVSITGLISPIPARVGAYFIDRTEVTNASYQEFVAAGGYTKPEFWNYPFYKDGTQLTFEQAMAELVDSTGRPGPAEWVLGDYPDGQDLYPVGGVSWYEAAAYAEFRGKSLPTVFHWIHAALSPTERTKPMAPFIIPASNFASAGPSPVARFTGMGYSGAYDLAGNVREWCLNPSGFKRYSMGGGWEDLAYMFAVAQPLPPFERPPYQGFRCAIYSDNGKPGPETARNLEIPTHDFSTTRPVSDDVFQMFLTQSSYAKTPLNAKIENVEELPGARRETVTIDAAYDNERLIIHIDLPLDQEPPYHALIWAPGGNSVMENKFRLNSTYEPVVILPKSGRAVVYPILAGTFERGGGPTFARLQDPAYFLEMIFRWMKDFGRTIDYLETREDIITSDLAWGQMSASGRLGGMTLSLNDRIKVAISISGGLAPIYPRASTTPDFAFWSRVKIPVLMLNGRYDYLNPYETNVKVLFDVIGTSIEDKKLVLYDAGHVPLPRNEVIKEMIDWLDKYQTATDAPSDEASLADSQTK